MAKQNNIIAPSILSADFAKLGKEVMMKIVGKFLVELKEMVLDKNIAITITDDTLDYLVDKGFDPKMGASPMERLINNAVKKPIADALLFGGLKPGDTAEIAIKKGRVVMQRLSKSKKSA